MKRRNHLIFLLIAILLSITCWGEPVEAVSFTPAKDATKTIDQYLGAKGVEEWLSKHENDSYYLGTTYKPLGKSTYSKPSYLILANGQSSDKKSGHMNCTGFIASVMKSCGGDLGKMVKTNSGSYANGYNWQLTVKNKKLICYKFSNVTKALESGKLRRGDIIYFDPNKSGDCHLGFFWGTTSSENKMWNSRKSKGNYVGTLSGDVSNSTVYVFPIQHINGDSKVTDPAPPTLTKIENIDGGVKLYWKAAVGAESYAVYRRDGSKWTKVGTTKSTSYTDKTAEGNVTYYYTVASVKEGITGSKAFKTLGIRYIKTPKITKVDYGDGSVKLTWEAVAGAAKYRFYRKNAAGDYERLTETTSTSYTDKTVENGKSYVYTVRPVTKMTVLGGYVKSGKTVNYLSMPILQKLTAKEEGLLLEWQSVDGASAYRVYRKEPGGSFARIGNVADTFYLDEDVEPGKTYIYTVRCLDLESSEPISAYNKAGLTKEFPIVQ